jgi:serine/threonine-protein kinase
MSPEQASGSPVDARSDLYSLGVCLYECLAGQPPFEGDSPVVVATRHVYATPPPLRDLRPDLPPAFEAVTARAMAKDPGDRYQTAAEFSGDLRSAHAGRAVAMPGPAEPVAPLTGPGPTARQPAAKPEAVSGGRAPGGWPRALLRWPVVLGLAVVVGVGMFVAGWPPSYDRAQGGPQGGGFQAELPGPGQDGASTTTTTTLPEGQQVPNVVGITLAKARLALEAAGFDPDRVTVTRRTSTGPPNLVLSQSPGAGALARDGEITLTVSREALPGPTTSTLPTTSTSPSTSTSTSTTSTSTTSTTTTTTTTLAPTET